MKYLIAGLIIGGAIGQCWAYGVAGQHPLQVEVPVVGECQLPPQVARMQQLVDRMPLPIRTALEAPAPAQRDQIALLIEEVR